MKRGAAVVISVVLVAIMAALFVLRHYRSAVLSPTALASKLPNPPKPPEDCSEIRRAMALSAQSVASGHEEKLIKIAAPLDADETAIYTALIQQWNSGQRKALSVSAKTFSLELPSPQEETDCGCLAGLSAQSLLKASHSFHVLTQNDLHGKNIQLVDPLKRQ